MAGALQRQWDKRVAGWHTHVTSADAFEKVLNRILAAARPTDSDVCVDLGAGTGFVTVALAPLVSSVLAVDISPAMVDTLSQHAHDAGMDNTATEVCDLRNFRIPRESVDLVVSSYALHHLHNADKRALVARAASWLRPSGRVVIADMMFGRGGNERDRRILRQKLTALAAKGPGGWWRIVKNLIRYGLGVGQEHPAPPEFWLRALRDAGLADVRFEPVVAEAGIVHGVRPGCPRDHQGGGTARVNQFLSSRPAHCWCRQVRGPDAPGGR